MPNVETNRRKILDRLLSEGWYLVRLGSGHDIYRHAALIATIVLPRHRTLSPGVARQIAKIAGWV